MKGNRILSEPRTCMNCNDHKVPTDDFGYIFHYCSFHEVNMNFEQLKRVVCIHHNWKRD